MKVESDHDREVSPLKEAHDELLNPIKVPH